MTRPRRDCTAALIACLFIVSAPVGAQSSTSQASGDHPAGGLAQQLAQGRVVLREIRFAPGSDRISHSSSPVLQELAQALVASSGVFLIEGHTDPATDAGSAQLLSERRAVAVKAWLVSEGVAAGRLLAVGYGASRPGRTNQKHNARIEVTRVQ
jgi:outer membrane protein OmpA-like peptidoglycan-associated protein